MIRLLESEEEVGKLNEFQRGVEDLKNLLMRGNSRARRKSTLNVKGIEESAKSLLEILSDVDDVLLLLQSQKREQRLALLTEAVYILTEQNDFVRFLQLDRIAESYTEINGLHIPFYNAVNDYHSACIECALDNNINICTEHIIQTVELQLRVVHILNGRGLRREATAYAQQAIDYLNLKKEISTESLTIREQRLMADAVISVGLPINISHMKSTGGPVYKASPHRSASIAARNCVWGIVGFQSVPIPPKRPDASDLSRTNLTSCSSAGISSAASTPTTGV